MMPAKAELLSSPRNPLLKEIRKAALRGVLSEDGYCVAESFHLLDEALRSQCRVKAVVAAESVRGAVERHVQGLPDVRLLVLPDELFDRLATTETSQGVLALVYPPRWTLEHILRGQSLVLVLDGLQDPGNAGTIVRAAEAFGASGIAFLKGSVSPYNPKTLRAAAGSIFRLPLVPSLDADLLVAALEQKRLDVYSAMPRASKLIAETDFTRRCAIVIGSEGRGVSPRMQAAATPLRIPTMQVESLNAALAAGVFLYEACRQRMQRP